MKLGVRNQVIGFCGYAGVGKDTAYQQLAAQFPQLLLQRVAFADPLKYDVRGCEEALKAMGVDLSIPENKEKFRDMWVWWSRVSKRFDPLIWVKRANPVIHAFIQRGQWVCVTDFRYDFEIEILRREKKAIIFYIDRPGAKPANAEEEMSFHAIHKKFPQLVDPHGGFYFMNDGTKEELGAKIKARICELFDINIPRNECEVCNQVVEKELRVCDRCGRATCPDCLVLDFTRSERRCKECNSKLGA